MNNLENLTQPPSLKEMAFQALKSAILDQRLLPGEIYTEKALADELGISKTPVREALLDLSNKGFVRFISRRGIEINAFTIKEIQDLYEVRRALELAIIKNIIKKLKIGDFKKIDRLIKEGKTALIAGDRSAYQINDRKFHLFLAKLTNNQYMISSIENIRDLLDWMCIKALYRPDYMIEAQEEHEQIFKKLKDSDLTGAENCVEYHIKSTIKKVLEMM
jgi:DNA-binding GntR family transcriptional regulator